MITNRRSRTANQVLVPALALGAALAFSGCASVSSAGLPPSPAEAAVSPSGPSEESAESSTAQTSEGAEVPSDSEMPTEVPIVASDPESIEPTQEPVQISYPDIDAEMPVEPRGVSSDGQMDVPEDAAQAGWYEHGKAPADDVGTTVITAHAGSEHTPVGPLYGLTESEPGQEVTVTDDAGEEHRYEITDVSQHGKDGLDFSPYFERSGEHRLVLITCGGQWIPEQNSYAENIIVVAEPVT